MLIKIVQILFIVLMPALLIHLTKQFKVLRYVGPILLAYLVGIIMANIGIVPWDMGLSMSISEIAVPVAIPLVLMCTNLIKWLKLAKTTVLAFVLVMVAAMLASFLSVFVFRNSLDLSWKIAGMLTGCYTGGTPNLIAVGMSLEVPPDMIVLVNTSDMLWGGLYFLLVTSVMKKVYRRFLPAFKHDDRNRSEVDPFMSGIFDKGIKHGTKNIARTLGLSILATGISIGFSFILTDGISLIPILLMVTTIGVGLSFVKSLHQIEGTWNIAEYVILLFSIGLGGTLDLREFMSANPIMILYVGTMMLSGIIIHFFLCKFFKIDSDTALITSVAGIYGPAFIAPVANALDNQEVVVSGLITGLVGYAVGNYLGLLVAFLMKIIL